MDPAFKDISFSSYLKTQNHTQNQQENDAELSVFDAHKYFSESSNLKDIKTQKQQLPDDTLSIPRLSSVSSVDGYDKNFRIMPTASSEVSWNSRTGLLAKPPTQNSRADHRSKKSAAVKKWFGTKCCCSGKRAVQVKKVITASEHKAAEVIINTNVNDGKSNCLNTKRDQIQSTKDSAPVIGFGSAEAPRKQRISASGPPFLDSGISFTFPVLKPSAEQFVGAFPKPIVDLNKISQRETNHVAGAEFMIDSRRVVADDDIGSDSSSDLFEIENICTESTPYPICALGEDRTNGRRMGTVDAEAAEADGDAPSEISIDWSVATAEGGEITDPALLKLPGGDGERRKGSGGMMLLGCRQEKAVRVAADSGTPPRGNKPPIGNCQPSRRSVAFAA